MSRLTFGPRRLGPGSLVMVVGLAAFALFGYLSQPGPIKSTYYEADSAGTLKLVDRPSARSGRRPLPLDIVKPEPTLLLRESLPLKLTAEQRSKLNEIDKSWTTTKQLLQRQMDAEVALAAPQKQSRISVADLQSGFSEYSRLSAAYDVERRKAWQHSTNILSVSQRQKVERFLQGGVQ